MPEPSSARRALYDDFVPAYIDFARCHRGRRTTHQLELALDGFFRWLAERGVPDLRRKGISPHTFRQTKAMNLLQAGVASVTRFDNVKRTHPDRVNGTHAPG